MTTGRSFHDGAGTLYTPFFDNDGRVGYLVQHQCGDGYETRIYLNASDSADDGQPNVFLYMGASGDPALDAPCHFYNVEPPR